MRDPYAIIKNPRVTEKGSALAERVNQYVFEVARDATKIEIKFAVERIFNKKVTSVNTLNVRGKASAAASARRRPPRPRRRPSSP